MYVCMCVCVVHILVFRRVSRYLLYLWVRSIHEFGMWAVKRGESFYDRTIVQVKLFWCKSVIYWHIVALSRLWNKTEIQFITKTDKCINSAW